VRGAGADHRDNAGDNGKTGTSALLLSGRTKLALTHPVAAVRPAEMVMASRFEQGKPSLARRGLFFVASLVEVSLVLAGQC